MIPEAQRALKQDTRFNKNLFQRKKLRG